MSLFLWIVIGVGVGWLATQLMRNSGYGQTGNIVLGAAAGVAGGIATGWLLGMNTAGGFNIETFVGAGLAAIVAVFAGLLYKRSQTNV